MKSLGFPKVEHFSVDYGLVSSTFTARVPRSQRHTLCLKKSDMRIMPHNSHKNRALSVTSDTVNLAAVLYNLS